MICLFDLSAIPARALYRGAKAANIPKTPRALMHEGFGFPCSVGFGYPTPSGTNANSSVKANVRSAAVGLRVHTSKIDVRIKQPCLEFALGFWYNRNQHRYMISMRIIFGGV